MCEVKNKSIRKSFTGYKLVNKVDNKYYSPVMGIEYIQNKRVIPVLCPDDANFDFTSNNWASPTAIFRNFYDKKMIGKTGVFYNLKDVTELLDEDNETELIVKMTISNNLYTAVLTNMGEKIRVIVGEFIESIEEIK